MQHSSDILKIFSVIFFECVSFNLIEIILKAGKKKAAVGLQY